MGKNRSKNWRLRGQGKGGRSWQQGRVTQDAGPSSSQSTSETNGEMESDIPGFYYDKESKQYFKILPNTMSSVSSFMTKESISNKAAEENRQRNIENLPLRQAKTLSTALFSPKDRREHKRGLVEVLEKIQCGQVTCQSFQSLALRHRCITLQPGPEFTCRVPAHPTESVESVEQMVSSPSRDYLACVVSFKSSVARCIQLLSVSKNLLAYRGQTSSQEPNPSHPAPPAVKPVLTTEPVFKKIRNLCWANLAGHVNGRNAIIYTANCPIGYSPTVVYAEELNHCTGTTDRVFELNLGASTVWSTAWHYGKHLLGVGCERRCQLIDVATRRTWDFYTHNSDPLALAFADSAPYKLYIGTRGGHLIVHDIRSPSRERSQQMFRQAHRQAHGHSHRNTTKQAHEQTYSISCVRARSDDVLLMTSDFSGQIVTWDQRMGRVVQRYEGLRNSHFQLPFALDESESVVCGAGCDGYTRLWDVRSSAVLHSIPPPRPVGPECFTHPIYAQHWGRTPGNSCLILAVSNVIKLYC